MRSKEIGGIGRLSEAKSAKRLGGSASKGSGCGEIHKGDIEVGEFLIEHKVTEAGSLSVKHAWLQKISMESRGQEKTPALQVVFARGDGRPKPSGSWVMIPEWRFMELLNSE